MSEPVATLCPDAVPGSLNRAPDSGGDEVFPSGARAECCNGKWSGPSSSPAQEDRIAYSVFRSLGKNNIEICAGE
jgi:hypothetical protein